LERRKKNKKKKDIILKMHESLPLIKTKKTKFISQIKKTNKIMKQHVKENQREGNI